MEDRVAYIGIDPGKSGGIAVVFHDAPFSPEAYKMPDTEAGVAELIQEISGFHKPVVYLEKVHAMPRQGVSSTFTFGMGYGFLRGVLVTAKIRFEDVTPQKWQKKLGCLSKGNKNVTKQKAQQLFPDIKVTHAIADAMLIAEYARRTEQGL
jgi:hypothetical protein